MDLAVGEALVSALEVLLPALDLVLAGQDALLDLRDPAPLLCDLSLDLRPKADGLLTRLDLRLAADCLRLSARFGHARPAEEP